MWTSACWSLCSCWLSRWPMRRTRLCCSRSTHICCSTSTSGTKEISLCASVRPGWFTCSGKREACSRLNVSLFSPRSHPVHVHRHQGRQEAVQEEIWSPVSAGHHAAVLRVCCRSLDVSVSVWKSWLSSAPRFRKNANKENDLSDDDVRTIRASLCGLVKYYISKGMLQEEMHSILGYIAAIGDEDQVNLFRSLTAEFLTSKVKFSTFVLSNFTLIRIITQMHNNLHLFL